MKKGGAVNMLSKKEKTKLIKAMSNDQRAVVIHNAIGVILSDKEKYTTTLNWAVNYCRVGLLMKGHELNVQCLYILNNITGWRHPRAKEVREALKMYSKE